MRTIARISAITAITAVLFQFAACKKKPVEPPVEVCNITHMKFSGINNQQDANFTYNSAGNPLSVTVSTPGTGNPNVIFFYDKYNRITDYVEPYTKIDPANLPSQFIFELWIRYSYADQNPASLPVADTTRSLGNYVNGQFVLVTPVVTNHYTYDSQGRISTFNSIVFAYDANGDLIKPNTTYDDKKSFLSTNKVWMFVSQNYSVHNPFTATAYNDSKLPTLLPNSNITFLHRLMTTSIIDYSCTITSNSVEQQ